jgi:glycosyltransferase involved in cell wall biosynthesis
MTGSSLQAQHVFSVVIPTRGRPQQLKRCLAALANLETAVAFEVVVVDDGGTLELSREDRAGLEHVEVLKHGRAGPAAARNAGVAAAAGDWIAFVDDDCQAEPGWLSALADALGSHPRDAIAGRVVNALPDDVYAEATQQLIDYARNWYASSDPVRRYATSNNLAVGKLEFLDIGGFDSRFALAGGEDREFSRRWLAAGRRIIDAPDAVVRHAHQLSLRTFLRQHFNYGRGAFTFHGADAAAADGRFSAWRFYAGLLVSPLRSESRVKGAALSALLVSSQAATAAGYLWEACAEHKPSPSSFEPGVHP